MPMLTTITCDWSGMCGLGISGFLLLPVLFQFRFQSCWILGLIVGALSLDEPPQMLKAKP